MQVELTGLSFGCGNVTVSCSRELLLVVERVNYIHGTECDGEDRSLEGRFPRELADEYFPRETAEGTVNQDVEEFRRFALDKSDNKLRGRDASESVTTNSDVSNTMKALTANTDVSESRKALTANKDASKVKRDVTMVSFDSNEALGRGGEGNLESNWDTAAEENVEIWDAVVSHCSGFGRDNCVFNIGTTLPHLRDTINQS